MTDNEIIKGLECCANHSASSNFRLTYQGQPLKLLLDNALDLINRQKAEIESKTDLIHRQSDVISEQKEKLESIYSEAIKEFAERLKEYREIVGYDRDLELDIYGSHIRIDIDEFDNLVKEMVGEG